MANETIRIGDVLRQYGYISEEQIATALEYQKNHSDKRLGTILIELGMVSEKQMLEALGQRLDLQVVDLSVYQVDAAAAERIPRQLAVKYNIMAVSVNGNRLGVVMSDPLNLYAVEDIRQITQMTLDIMLDVQQNVSNAIDYYYSEIEARAAARMINTSAMAQAPTIDVADDGGEESPVVQVLNRLLFRGYSNNASDVHIEPFEGHVSVRMRMDGVITDYVTLPQALHLSLIARVKILSNLDIAERRLPQDGHFKVIIEGTQINARVSVIPTIFGEKAVIRFLFPRAIVDEAERFGMTQDNYQTFCNMMNSPHGIVYITGPTGSGKTTTLYMALERLSARSVNISTIEDPVERNIERVNQVQVNNAAGMTFDVGLRSLLRQDPDVIMVGETRDSETASISVRAAITGHLVLSTLHTNDAVSSIIRLRDMGIPSYLIANSLVGLAAQRLVRKLCPHCKQPYAPEAGESAALGVQADTLYRPTGCHVCNNTGYRGRMAVHEVLQVDSAIRRMITREEPMEAVEAYIRQEHDFKTLKDAAATLVLDGVTSMSEFYKVAFYSQ